SGPLRSLPPGLLVDAAPQGGVAGASNPSLLRTTPWLIRSKAIALLPAVSSLRMLRQLIPTTRPSPSDPLLAFADPDFGGVSAPFANANGVRPATSRGFASYFRDGHPMADVLHSLPRLPGTRSEGEALEEAL